MFFVRKAAEPIGGDDAPLPGSAAVNAAGPSGRARYRHNKQAPLLDAPATGTAERPFWTRLLPARQAPSQSPFRS